MNSALVSTQQVLSYLGISRPTLRAMQRATPEEYVGTPWVNVGTATSPTYRWHTGPLLDEWAKRTSQWRSN